MSTLTAPSEHTGLPATIADAASSTPGIFSGDRIVIHAGSQDINVPRAVTTDMADRIVDSLEAWTTQPSPTGANAILIAGYNMLKPLVGFLWPWIPRIVEEKAKLPSGTIPPLPKRPRHTDPVIFLLRHVYGLLRPFLVHIASVTVEVDAAGDMTRLYADILGQRHVLWPDEAAGDQVVEEEGAS